MVDIDSHRIIDILYSRDLDEVTAWLSSYPNLQVVSRDGSITYNNAISIAHPKAIQVSDRFHILKNLTSYCKEYLLKYFKSNVEVRKSDIDIHEDENPTNTESQSRKEKSKKAIEMINLKMSKSEICRVLNMYIRTLNKLVKINKNDLDEKFMSVLKKKQKERLFKKQELIARVREL